MTSAWTFASITDGELLRIAHPDGTTGAPPSEEGAGKIDDSANRIWRQEEIVSSSEATDVETAKQENKVG